MVFAFGDFELDESLFELRRAGRRVQIQPKVLLLVLHLVKHRDRVVTNGELRSTFWPAQRVGDSSLTKAVRSARIALGDSGTSQATIRTVRGRGYVFAVAVGVEPAVASMAEDLSAEARLLVHYSRLIGHEFSLALLAAVLDMPRDLRMEVLQETRRRRVPLSSIA